MTAKTLYDKLWDAHQVPTAEGGPSLLFIDRHLVHEVTSPQAFEGLQISGRAVRHPELTSGTGSQCAYREPGGRYCRRGEPFAG